MQRCNRTGSLASDRFWYRRTGRDGATFVRVDPATGTRARCLRSCAAGGGALARGGSTLCAHAAALRDIHLRRRRASDPVRGGRQAVDVRPDDRTNAPRATRGDRPKTEVRSPDGKWAAFVRDDNLFLRERATGTERSDHDRRRALLCLCCAAGFVPLGGDGPRDRQARAARAPMVARIRPIRHLPPR